MAAKPSSAFAGDLFLFPGRGLYVGRAADTAAHAHHAVQICIGIDGDVEIELADGDCDGIQRARSIVIKPDLPHRLRAATGRVVLVYLEPEADDARLILNRSEAHVSHAPSSMLVGGRDLAALDGLDAGAARAICDTVVAELAGGAQRPRAIDDRIDRATAAMRDRLDPAPRIAELASEAGLSVGRFGHLFREVTGIPVRRYRLWLRLVAGLGELTSGCSLTEAAHAAGFADSAHMTRTFRRMLGIAPSALHRHSRFVQAKP